MNMNAPRPAYQKYELRVAPSPIDGLGVFAAEPIAAARKIGEIRGEGSYWPGAGWTGQPLLVKWPDATRAARSGASSSSVTPYGSVE